MRLGKMAYKNTKQEVNTMDNEEKLFELMTKMYNEMQKNLQILEAKCKKNLRM